jgi:uncharacterized protein (DUF1810 family)
MKETDVGNDPYNLQRFVEAQNSIQGRGTVFTQACAELRRGGKETHWMWFIFPQLRGLGHSFTAEKYAISGRKEAEAYLEHPLLGPRLRECARLVNEVGGLSVSQIFSYPDYLKFHSCMTLFANITSDNAEFVYALEKFFAEKSDAGTVDLLSREDREESRPRSENR